MEIKNRMWMNGSLEWYAYIGDGEVYLGKREVPIPLDEGDEWVNEYGDMFRVTDGEIIFIGRTEPPQKHW